MHWAARWLCGLLGIAVMAMAIAAFWFPPVRITTEKDETQAIGKQVEQSADVATPFTVAFLASVALFAYGVNGYRLTKFSAGSIAAESESQAGTEAETFFSNTTPESSVETKYVEKPSPEPTESPVRVVERDGDSLAVFNLDDVPISVITDAVANWPEDTPQPNNLADFEFAARKRGKGNHPWTVKFNGSKAVKVSYGGHGKTGATVETN